jgi:hypothetical protein
MAIITTNTTNGYNDNGTIDVTYYPLQVDDLGIHRPFSHRYSVFVQFRYCEAKYNKQTKKTKQKIIIHWYLPHEAGSSDPSPKQQSSINKNRKTNESKQTNHNHCHDLNENIAYKKKLIF